MNAWKQSIRGLAGFLITGLWLVGFWAAAVEVGVGDEMPALKLADQHEKKATIEGARVVILVFDRDLAKTFNEWLDARGADWLPEHDAVYVADVSGMLSGLTNWYAIGKMRDCKHRILLNRDNDFAASFPRKKNMATVLRINRSGTITSVAHLASPAALKTLLK